jgi:UDP-N-acetylglucosamine:LPS N-acetylglucosamine transferase
MNSIVAGSRTVRIAFFSRGRGRGHAIPDMALMEELRKLDNDFELHWVSYGTGAATLRNRGHEVIDLQLPDTNPFLETQLRSTRLLAKLQPNLVISHEEFAAAPAAKLFGTRVLFITDYFREPNHIWMQCLSYADEIIFIDNAGFFAEPYQLRNKIHYAGPLVRNFGYCRQDRERARNELGLPSNAIVIIVLPGNWFTEARAPIFDLVMPAFRSLKFKAKRLVWIAGLDHQMLLAHTRNCPDVIVREEEWEIDRWMVASDLAITKGTRKTSMELAALGIPSISLSHGLNQIDDLRVNHIRTNTHLKVSETKASDLADHISRILRASPGRQHAVLPTASGLTAAVLRIAAHVSAVREI